MGRPKKKPTVDLAILEKLPEMVAALGYLAGMADKIGNLAPKVGMYRGAVVQMAGQSVTTPKDLGSSPTAPQVVLDTPERREWMAQQQEVAQAVEAERAKTAPPKKLPKRQQEAIQLGLLGDASKRSALLANFQHDGPPEGGETVAATEQLEALSEAT